MRSEGPSARRLAILPSDLLGSIAHRSQRGPPLLIFPARSRTGPPLHIYAFALRVRLVCRRCCGTLESTSSSAEIAGPFNTSPVGEKREPWHGQSQLFSAPFHSTTHLRCVHTADFSVTRP